ncbi:MAG: Uma2 family endonuclease [Clostridiales bacterium]|nr:Uma2 family endonuclease [Clostridiales bacterium]
MPLPNEEGRYTFADLCAWDDDERWELVDGIAYLMAAPSVRHQGISGELAWQLGNFLDGKPCKVYAAVGVRLNWDTTDDTVFIPDLVVVCDRSKIVEDSIKGAPDLVIEILSPSTERYDKFIKLLQYEKAGVRECWVVDPVSKTVNTNILVNGLYNTMRTYLPSATIPVSVLEGCEIDLERVFAE